MFTPIDTNPLVVALGSAITLFVILIGWIVRQAITSLQKRTDKLDGQINDLRASGDLERSNFSQRSIDYQTRVDNDAKIIDALKEDIHSLRNVITDLQDQVTALKSKLITERNPPFEKIEQPE